MNLRVLAIVAHPADAFDMIGGTLANHLEDNDKVTLVILQSNDLSNLFSLADAQHGGQLNAEAIQQALENHRASTKAACGILGIENVRFLEFPEEWITYSTKLVAGIADLIQELRPHLLLTHHPMEDGGASEHGTCGKAVIEATYLADGARKSGLAPHHTGQIYFFCPPGTTNLLDATTAFRYPGIMVDVTRQIEKRVFATTRSRANPRPTPLGWRSR